MGPKPRVWYKPNRHSRNATCSLSASRPTVPMPWNRSRVSCIQTGSIGPMPYGAADALNRLGITELPTTLVVGPDGIVTWNSSQPGTLHDAILRALDQAGL